MSPTVSLAGPGEILAVLEPYDVVMHVEEGLVGLGEHGGELHRADIAVEDPVCVLGAVEPLNHHLVRAGHELHAGQVVLSRVALELEPAGGGLSGIHVHYADAGG